MKRLRRCMRRHYSLNEACPACGGETFSAHPPKYSPHDKYASYRRRQTHG
ncbi:ribosome biogenesis protein [Candidatus Micrarchaeota archaeon]|nr:ribosome biogenesis protein [Candidatus Micrarchaeota archaeon]